MNRRTWHEIDFSTIPFSCVISQGYFLNGTLHWLVESDKKPYYCIVTLNLSTEVFGTIALDEFYWLSVLTIIKGSPGVITNDKTCWISVMEEYNNGASWCAVSDFGDTIRKEDIESVGQLTNGYFVFKRKKL